MRTLGLRMLFLRILSEIITADNNASIPLIKASGESSHGVSMMPRAGISELWKTIAPVMLPKASVSLPCLTQMMLLNFSGSSVAIGVMMIASTNAGIFHINESVVRAPTKKFAPAIIAARAADICKKIVTIEGLGLFLLKKSGLISDSQNECLS